MKVKRGCQAKLIPNRGALGLFLNWLSLKGEGVEVGVDEANFSCSILNKWNGKLLHLVDPWEHQDKSVWRGASKMRFDSQAKMDEKYLKAVEVTSQFKDRVNIIRDFSANAVKRFQDNSLDFVYIDGNHNYDVVMEDIHLWYSKVKVGGLLCGHDYYWRGRDRPTDVKLAVDEFVVQNELELGLSWQQESWFIFKEKNL